MLVRPPWVLNLRAKQGLLTFSLCGKRGVFRPKITDWSLMMSLSVLLRGTFCASCAYGTMCSHFASGGLSRLRRSILELRAHCICQWSTPEASLWQRLHPNQKKKQNKTKTKKTKHFFKTSGRVHNEREREKRKFGSSDLAGASCYADLNHWRTVPSCSFQGPTTWCANKDPKENFTWKNLKP